MKRNGLLTLLFAFIPGAGQMYQGYMKRGLSLATIFCLSIAISAGLQVSVIFVIAPIVYMYSFFDTFNLRAQIELNTAPEDDYLVHFDPRDKRLLQMMMDSHKLVGWACIAFGALFAYQGIFMNTLGDIMWRWGKNNAIFRAIYLVMEELPEVVFCVVLIVFGIWLVKGPNTHKKTTTSPEEPDFQEYQPEDHSLSRTFDAIVIDPNDKEDTDDQPES